MEKTDTDIEKYIEKNVEKSSKIDPRTTKKHGKSKNDQKMTKKSAWGANFCPEGGFGSILGSLERLKNSHFERKMRDGKKDKNKW